MEKWVEQLVEEVYPGMLLYGISLAKSRAEAEDLAQEALYRFLLIYDRLEAINYKSWLLRVMRNYYFDNQRKKKKSQALLADLAQISHANTEDLLHQIIRKKEHERLYQAIATLKDPYKEVLVAYYFLDLSIKNIAEITDLKLSNVKVLLHRGRKQLKEVMMNEKLS